MISTLTNDRSKKHESFQYDIKNQFNITDFNRLGFEKARKIMLIGALDSGKTTLCRRILSFFLQKNLNPVCFFDLDLGQTSVGPPCTIGTMYIQTEKKLDNLIDYPIAHLAFIGSLYPYSFENKIYKSIKRILKLISNESRIVIDTTGYKKINSEVALFKCRKIEIIAPDILILLSETLNIDTKFLKLLNKTAKAIKGKLLLFPCQNSLLFKSKSMRRANHLKAFRYWLEGATYINLSTNSFGDDIKIDDTEKAHGTLVGLMDEKGLCIGGGVLICKSRKKITIYGKLQPGGEISSISIGTLKFEINSWSIIYKT